MFDTSVVHSRAIAAPRRFALFAVSLVLHSAAVVAAIVLTVASTQMPAHAPNQMELYRPAVVPTVPPPYGHPAHVKPQQPNTTPAPRPAQVTAPTAIPDQVPAAAPTSGNSTAETIEGEGEPGGVPWGEPGGIGDPTTTVQQTATQAPEIYVPGGEVTPARVIRRVEPRYPQMMIAARMSAVVTVRCIIDRSGNVRNPEIVQSSYPPFNDAVLAAVSRWTFVPGTLRGQPVDTWFELTVRFIVQ